MTIWSNYEQAYTELKKEFDEKYSSIKLLPNIFEGELVQGESVKKIEC